MLLFFLIIDNNYITHLIHQCSYLFLKTLVRKDNNLYYTTPVYINTITSNEQNKN